MSSYTQTVVSVFTYFCLNCLFGQEEDGLQAGGMGPTVVEERPGVARTAATCSSRAPHPDQPPATKLVFRAMQMSDVDIPAMAGGMMVASS